MPVFAYTAQLDDRKEKGTLVADTAREARDTLRDRGLELLTLVAKDRAGASEFAVSSGRSDHLPRWRWPQLGTISRSQTVLFFRELATLTEVGVPVIEAIDILIEQQPPRASRFKTVLLGVRDRVASGRSLADAFMDSGSSRRYPIFDEASVAMIRVGEEVGRLGEVLSNVADYRERQSAMKNRLVSALIYPAVVGAFGLGVCLFLMTSVVPGILEALDDTGQTLPWPTVIVKAFSDALIGFGLPIGLAVVALAIGFTLWLHHPGGREKFDRVVLSMPLIGETVRKQAVVRISFTVSTLLEAGVSFERSLSITKHAIRNSVLHQAIDRCIAAVHEGRDLGPAIRETRAFPATVARVFSLGQESGRLSALLRKLSEQYDQQVATLTQRLTTIVEPVLIVVLAVLVGFIALATLLPILELGHAL
ncbi:MAG: type II secretion system F family protein [Planctomycetota bacterium]